MCHMSCVMCHVLCVTGHLSTAKNTTKFQNAKNIETTKTRKVQRHANISDMLFNQKSPVHREMGFPRWHTQTTSGHCDLETESAQWANSVKTLPARVNMHQHRYLNGCNLLFSDIIITVSAVLINSLLPRNPFCSRRPVRCSDKSGNYVKNSVIFSNDYICVVKRKSEQLSQMADSGAGIVYLRSLFWCDNKLRPIVSLLKCLRLVFWVFRTTKHFDIFKDSYRF